MRLLDRTPRSHLFRQPLTGEQAESVLTRGDSLRHPACLPQVAVAPLFDGLHLHLGICIVGQKAPFAGALPLDLNNGSVRGDQCARSEICPSDPHFIRPGARKKEMEYFGSLKPPPFMGTDYGPPPRGLVSDALGKFFGAPAEQDDAADDTVAGNAGSSGKVRGTARVLRSLDEADKLGVGEILVAQSTSPSSTPLFGIAAGIVTDTGGILSHCAVVAREYGIPAVVGTGVATSTIMDGQTIEVDGDAGRVRLFD